MKKILGIKTQLNKIKSFIKKDENHLFKYIIEN